MAILSYEYKLQTSVAGFLWGYVVSYEAQHSEALGATLGVEYGFPAIA